MEHVTLCRPHVSIFAVVLGAAIGSATLLSPLAVNMAQAQTEPLTAANGVLLPSPYYDPGAARIADLAESAVVPVSSTAPVSPADESTATDAPETVAESSDDVADAPNNGNSETTVLGGSDVAVSSVGGSHEVDGPGKRSERKR